MTENVEEGAAAEWLDLPFDSKTADSWDRANRIHHGLLKHSLVHEAGHAVAAARLNIEFVDVSVMPPEGRTPVNDGFIGGGLQLVRFEHGWAADCIDDAYEMLLMGMETERRMLQDALNGGYLQDVERFKVAANYLDGVPAADAQQLGQRFNTKIDENWPQIEQDIRALVAAFAAQFTASGAQVMSALAEPLLLTSAEVHSILDIEKPTL